MPAMHLCLCVGDSQELDGSLEKLSGKLILQGSTGNISCSNG